MAKSGLCSVLEFGKLPWPEIEDYNSYLGNTDPQVAKANQENAEVQKMIEMFKNIK